MNKKTKQALAQFIMREILELESLPLSDRATEEYLSREIDNKYFRLHKLYDGECKRGHDEVNGTKDYHIVEWDSYIEDKVILILKHKLSGFVPRLKSN